MASPDLPKHRQRGDATRAAILAAARERFAADGYDRATVRAIAADAGADPSLVIRYYGSKEKLFAIAAEFDLRLSEMPAVPRTRIGEALVEHFLKRWEEDEALQALLRTAMTDDGAAERARGIFAAQVGPMIAKLSGEAASAATRAGLVSSQLLGFALCRYVLKLPPIVKLRRPDAVKWVAPTVQRYITGKA